MATSNSVEIAMPQMGDSVTEGTILEWHKQVGDVVANGETIVEISTDKVDSEVPAPIAGKLLKIHAEEGETVTVGTVLAELEPVDGDAAPFSNGSPDATSQSASASAATAAGAGGTSTVPAGKQVTPVAQRAAAAHGVDLAQVQGSGPGGRISKQDVLTAADNGGAAPAAASAGAEQLKGGAAMLARYMDESRSIPTATSFRTLTVTTMDGRRKELKAAGQRVSFTHIIAYALAKAAADMPVMTHHFEELNGKPHRIDDHSVNLGIAVDVEKKDGSRTLMVPVIRNAGAMTFTEFMAAFGDLVQRSRKNKLTADDLTGANLTLTNPGGLGTIASVPRLMVGQGTIIATGSIAYPVGLGHIGGQIGAEKVMTMTSTYDHRIIQGAESGQFLKLVEEYLQGGQDFYEQLFTELGVALGPAPTPPAPHAATTVNSAISAATVTPDSPPDEAMLQAVQAAASLVKAHRTHGHLAAHLDPLGAEPKGDPSLDPKPLGLTPELMAKIPARIMRMYVPGATLADALPHLRETYCGSIAYEIEHISSHQQRRWLREQIESGAHRKPLTKDERKRLLHQLTQVDLLERFLQKAYLGQKQFSIEGLDVTVPMLHETVQLAGAHGADNLMLAMAHRGRLNVLAHNLGRSYQSIFSEFEGATTLEAVTTIPQGGTGDVKYHHGAEGTVSLTDEKTINIRLEHNPSHLEFVTPVAIGVTRAAQTNRQSRVGKRNGNAAVPILLHGDASFSGQGVIAETFNMQALDGYTVGGAVHIIMNNQLGFTTDPDEGRSTQWASDMAKGFDVPIIHVNADDVEACIAAVRLAYAFRLEFGRDALIDLIGYRRYGHNEADEPAFTQPGMYAKIKKHPRVREIYAQQIAKMGVVSEAEVAQLLSTVNKELTQAHQELKQSIAESADADRRTGEYKLNRAPSPDVKTAVSVERLRSLDSELATVPDGFTLHPKLKKQFEKRAAALEPGGRIDWAHAEALALAALVTEGTPVRMSGQDTERGTFSQRHLVVNDNKTGQHYSPIQNLDGALAALELHNSPLSEIAVLGFEYGYSTYADDALVIWEAQFGDFANAAQVIIDQFMVSGLTKWGQTSRLTLLLPHGYEGSGPEHSSARIERFLDLAAEGNIRVANLTTPAQYFHLLRRQARIAKKRPLVIFTPKSLLRLPQASNRIEHLSETQFYPVLAEPRIDEKRVKRLLLCSGKVFYDLKGHSSRQDNDQVAIGRVEMLYPFPERQLRTLIAAYPHLQEVVWVQEEPRNMGPRSHMIGRLLQIMPKHLKLGYIGRSERASTSEGYPPAHSAEQNRILSAALDMSIPVTMHPRRMPGDR